MVSTAGKHDEDEAEAPDNHEAYKSVDDDVSDVLPVGFVVYEDAFVEDEEREFD